MIKLFVFCIVSISGFVAGSLLDQKKPVIVADISNEINGQSLTVEGAIPSWLSGTFVQNGPVKVTVDGKSNKHWFDGLGMLHAFSFNNGAVTYTNKFLKSSAYYTVFKEGSLNYSGFNSSQSYLAKCKQFCKCFFGMVTIDSKNRDIQNANVNVAKIADAYVALTEVPLPVQFDLSTLDTQGNLMYQDTLPQKKSWESAHPYFDVHSKETINYCIEFGKNSYYLVYNIQEGSSERKVIARIPVQYPSYMHSFAVTKNYIIFTEFPLVVNPLDLMLKNQSYINNFKWKPEWGTKFILVNRLNGSVVGSYTTKPFFAFHHINAFEKDDFVCVDMVTYQDASILMGKSLFSDQLGKNSVQTKVERFSLSLATGNIDSFDISDTSVEFPAINNKYSGSSYTYAYASRFNDFNGALYKINMKTQEVIAFSQDGFRYGEPTFIPTPNTLASEMSGEDDGVVISLVVDSINDNSFLLCLDAKSFTEIGRAQTPHAIAHLLHGKFFEKL